MPERCLNLCELNVALRLGGEEGESAGVNGVVHLRQWLGAVCAEAGWSGFERLYLGSSFCGNAFLHNTGGAPMTALQQLSQIYDVPCTLVVPTPLERELRPVKCRVEYLLDAFSCIDEVTVNDYGMLAWLAGQGRIAVNVGRLFSKDLRDLRYHDGFPEVYRPALSGRALDDLCARYPRLRGIEYDPCGYVLDLTEVPVSLTAAVHVPYLFATTGAFCPYAPSTASGSPASAGAPCCQECNEAMTTYRLKGATGDLVDEEGLPQAKGRPLYYTKHGRTVFVLNEGMAVRSRAPYRMVYTPRHFGWLAGEEAAQ